MYPEVPQIEMLSQKVEKKDDEHKQDMDGWIPPPFPNRLQKSKHDSMNRIFLDILSRVHMNMPLVEELQEVPKYVKYHRDIFANKRKHAKFEIFALTNERSSRVQSNLTPKLKDHDVS